MDDGLVCALERRPLLRDLHVGRRRRTDRPAARTGPTGWGLACTSSNQHREWGAINVAGPQARDLLARLSDDAIDAAALPYPGHARHHGRRRPVPRDPRGVRGRAGVRAASPALAGRRAVGGTDRSGQRSGNPAARARRAGRAPAGEGPHLPGPGHAARRHARQAGSRWAVAMDKPWFIGKVALQRMAGCRSRGRRGLRFDRPPENVAERGAPLYHGRRSSDASRRPSDPSAQDGRSGWGGSARVDGAFPTALDAPEQAAHGARRAHAVLRPGGGAPPWLSSATSPRR